MVVASAAHDRTRSVAYRQLIGSIRRESLEWTPASPLPLVGRTDVRVHALWFNEDQRKLFAYSRRVQATSNSPAAPIPPPTHIVITTYLTPRRLPSISACPVIRDPLIP